MVSLDPFYPIVPDTNWLARLLPRGVKLVQLRVKDQPESVVRAEIEKAIVLCAAYRCELVINDYWREAIEAGAGFVHLGQEDLAAADLSAIRAAGIKIGVSTHNIEELEAALAAKADYVALGPIYATTLESHAVGPARPSPPRRMARRESPARWLRLAASRSTAPRLCLPRAPIPSPSSPTL